MSPLYRFDISMGMYIWSSISMSKVVEMKLEEEHAQVLMRFVWILAQLGLNESPFCAE